MNQQLALGYIRISLKNEDGISLDTQTNRIKEYCTYKKLGEPKIYKDDGLSGKNMLRPQLIEMLNNIIKGSVIIVFELSRLSRNTKDAIDILDNIYKKEATLICLNPDIDFSTPIGKVFFTLLSSFSQYEREVISKRVSENMKNLSKQNLLRPKPPFGWKFIDKGEDMIKDEDQQNVIGIIKTLYSECNSYNGIAKYLNDNNFNKVLNDSGDQIFYAQTIKNILSDCDLIVQSKRKKLKDKFLKSRRNLNIIIEK